MNIQSIGIIGGTGGIGKTFADFFREKFEDKSILVSGRKTNITNKKIVQECDLVIFSVPIASTVEVITSLKEYSRKDQIWMDFTSIKCQPVQAMLQSGAHVCGAHPMFAPIPLPQGQKVILTPVRMNKRSLGALEEIFEDFELFHSTPEEHDTIMAIVQGLSHFSDLALGSTMQRLGIDFEKVLAFASPPYELKLEVLGRMFAQNPNLYAQIAVENGENQVLMDAFSKTFLELKQHIDRSDGKALAKEFSSVRDFLGERFCQRAFLHSQSVLENLYGEKRIFAVPKKDTSSCEGAIFGGKGSHTDEASFLFSQRTKQTPICYCETIGEVFDLVENGSVGWGIVPYENANEGPVTETLDELFSRDEITIQAGHEKFIAQHLIGLPNTPLEQIQTILSHPQALAQSKEWIKTHLPGASLQTVGSTALGVRKVKQFGDPCFAAIGSEKVAHQAGLSVLAENIEALGNNTRFVLLQKALPPPNAAHTSFCFWFSENHPGALASVLQFLAEKKINVIKLDSRRAKKEWGGYIFFIDGEVSPSQMDQYRQQLQVLTAGSKILGGF